jgi:hypothetical protein
MFVISGVSLGPILVTKVVKTFAIDLRGQYVPELRQGLALVLFLQLCQKYIPNSSLDLIPSPLVLKTSWDICWIRWSFVSSLSWSRF